MPAAPHTIPSSLRRDHLRQRLLWLVPLLSLSVMFVTAYLLIISLDALGPLPLLQEFPLNLFGGLIICGLISVVSVGGGVLLSHGLCQWLLDLDGNPRSTIGSALRQWATAAILLLVLVFWSGVQFHATPLVGVTLMALAGGISGAWLGQHAHDIPAAYQVGWRRAMILGWGSGWAVATSLLYWLVG